MREDWTAVFQRSMDTLRDQAQAMLERVETATPAEAQTIFRELFETEAPRYDKAAKAAADMAEAMRKISDAMRAKLGQVTA